MIILVRHGEATHHTQRLDRGWTDSLLNLKGTQTNARLGEALAVDFASMKAPIIYASDLKRAALSADIIASALKVRRVERRKWLREKNNGRAANMTEEAAKRYLYGTDRCQRLGPCQLPGWRDAQRVFLRTIAGFAAMPQTKENIIIVVHKGTLQNIIFHWLGLSIDEVNTKNLSVDIRPALVTVLGVNKWQEHAIFLMNETNYLQSEKGLGLFHYKCG